MSPSPGSYSGEGGCRTRPAWPSPRLSTPVAWTVAAEPGGEIRDGAWVAELSGDCLKGWPNGG